MDLAVPVDHKVKIKEITNTLKNKDWKNWKSEGK